MTFRSLILASAATALVAVMPAHAQTNSAVATYSKAQSEVDKDAKKPVAKKAADKKATGKTVSKKNDKKQAKKPTGKDVAKKEPEEKKTGLFANLFGGQANKPDTKKADKPVKKMTKAEKAAAERAARAEKIAADKAAKVNAARQAKEDAIRRQQEETTLVASLDDDRPIELRSDANKPPPSLFGALFGGSQQRMLPETERRDRYLKLTEAKKGKKFTPKPELMPTMVDYDSSYKRGTIVVNTAERRLYLIESSGKARRYAIAVGRQGLEFKGNGKVGDKQEWPRWIPTQEMQQRDPKKYGQYKDGMDGGPTNPLGARAIYLYQGKKDTHIRVHGTTEPWTIGTSASNGCFRMINEHVMDLYGRVSMGADFVVL